MPVSLSRIIHHCHDSCLLGGGGVGVGAGLGGIKRNNLLDL